MWTLRGAASASVLLCLVACGGVSDTTNPPGSSNSPPPSLQLINGSVVAAILPGYSLPLVVTADVNGGAPDGSSVYMGIHDPAGVIEYTSVRTQSAGVNGIVLSINPKRAPGQYRGTAYLYLCSTAACDVKTYDHVALPYDLYVESPTNLTTLTPLAGAADWQTERGDNRQDGYVPVTLDPTKFTTRWILSGVDAHTYPTAGLSGVAPVTDSANQLVVTYTDDDVQPGLAAYSEVDGHEIWNLPLSGFLGGLSLYNGVIYLAVDGDLEALDDATGAVLFTAPLGGAIQDRQGAPIVVGGTVFVPPGTQGEPGLYTPDPVKAFDAATGTPLWTGPSASGFDSLATDGTDIYFYVPNKITPGALGTPGFTALDAATGTQQWQLPRAADPSVEAAYRGTVYLYGSTPVIDAAGGAVENLDSPIGPSPIERYDLASKSLIWTTGTSEFDTFYLNGVIAVGTDTVYAVVMTNDDYAPTPIHALDLNTGALRWSWQPPATDDGEIESMLVTQNILFVGTSNAVYAVDISTHTTVWIFALPGFSLSLSPSGILYVGTEASGPATPDDAALAAINLD